MLRKISKCFLVRSTAVSNRLKRRKRVAFLPSFFWEIMLPDNPYFAGGVRVCLSVKAMAKIVFKIAVNVTPLMLSYVENFWLCEYSKTISDLFIILLLLQTFLSIANYGFVSVKRILLQISVE